MIRAALATYYLARSLATLDGPGGVFAAGRAAVLTRRGFVRASDGQWYHSLGLHEGVESDWLAAGIGCPVCVAAYVAPLVLVAGRTRAGRALVGALAVAGAAAALWDRER